MSRKYVTSIHHKRRTALISSLVGALFLSACNHTDSNKSSSTPVATTKPAPKYQTEIRRTAFGVPHIKANDEAGLGFGAGYAYAQDNYCLLMDAFVTANGERARYFGAEAEYDATGADGDGAGQNNLSSDFYYKLINDDATVQAAFAQRPAEIQQLIRGYVAGVNRYLRDTGKANLPEACQNAEWVRDITELDVIRLMRRLAVLNSGAMYLDDIVGAQPPKPGASKLAFFPARNKRSSLIGKPRAAISNGIALGKEATETGAGMLLANPHFPWTTHLRFYQQHLTIPGKLDAAGASIGGLPVIQIGYNPRVAWTHTVNNSAHGAFFMLALDDKDPTRYLVDGVSKPLSKKTFTVTVKTASGALQKVERDIYVSEYGPILANSTLPWTQSMAFAYADANLDNNRLLDQWHAMAKTNTVAELKTSLTTIVGTPWVNTLAADRDGNTYYGNITPVPYVTSAKSAKCIAADLQPLMAEGIHILNGSNSACRLDTAANAPQKGIFPGDQLPSLLRSDYVHNANDSSWLSNPLQPLTGFAPVVSLDNIEQQGRTRFGLKMIADRLNGRDGLAGTRFSTSNLLNLAFSNRHTFATTLLPDLKALCRATPFATLPDGQNVDLRQACAILTKWDGTAETNSIGVPLFSAWFNVVREVLGDAVYATPFNPADPINTPSGIRLNDPEINEAARALLAFAAQQLASTGVDITKPWGDIHVAEFGKQRIPMHGGPDPEYYNQIGTKKLIQNGQLKVNTGSGFVMAVSFANGKPDARGILAFSQSTNPRSPHFADQAPYFASKNWQPFPFTDAEIKADPAFKTVSISE